ncbi:FERM, ARHGEF and pleckstrin domain-containing protein 1-like [Galendromus occidentalis]|uniref:FERM, ARHGEF and pleckstrin domain-containing protein 1-like n=1 Tax=Galendromus occidentalis TaxID=34638 RepID=A0AAJ7WJF9_9ACAR|nr:FERM, ARHGEF and pleckstrin domain-containing protein 1-like [Galendromus occidentalis]
MELTVPPEPESEAGKPDGKNDFAVDVKFLDDSVKTFQLSLKEEGQILFDQVCHYLNLAEKDYFGLGYQDTQGVRYWLDYGKRMGDQLGLANRNQPLMEFEVKFYVPDPTQLEEEYTRYLFALQIKKDLALGDLVAESENVIALLCSYVVQATFGDYVHSECGDGEYLSKTKFTPKQTRRFEELVMSYHKKHVGQSPFDADLNLLDHVRKCELYGVKIVSARDNGQVVLNLAVAHMGILVLQSSTRINTFSWSTIRKLSFKRKRFLIKFHPTEGYGYYKKVEEFTFDSRNAAKSFWKRCVENYCFFRLSELPKAPVRRNTTKIFSKGSSFRYSGRTQQQVLEFARDACEPSRGAAFRRTLTLRQGWPSIGKHSVDAPSRGSAYITATPPPASTSSPIVEEKRLAREDQHRRSLTSRSDHGNSRPQSLRLIAETNRVGNFLADDGPARNLFLELHSSPTQTPSNNSRPNSLQVEETSYYVSKELLMTERTYKRDLEIITFWFRNHFDKTIGCQQSEDENSVADVAFIQQLFANLEPMFKHHCHLLRDLEHRIAAMEGRPVTGVNPVSLEDVGSLLWEYCDLLVPIYQEYASKLLSLLEAYEEAFNSSASFRCSIESFEMHKSCYVPLTLLFTRPLHRLSHYARTCSKLAKCYHANHPDSIHCRNVIQKLKPVITPMNSEAQKTKNRVKLMELERDLKDVDGIRKKQFLLEGCLLKLSKKGFQQRMFFLFDDCLVFADRCPDSPGLKFKARGQVQLRGVVVEASEARMGNEYCFTLYAPQRALTLAAPSEDQRRRWLTAIQRAVDACSFPDEEIHVYSTLRSCSSSDNIVVNGSTVNNNNSINNKNNNNNQYLHLNKSNQYPRCNTTLHVCWLRQVSAARDDYEKAGLTQCMSGYLLRKFKHSTGWQKLWIVFSDFSLFFYKSYQDTTPLACLPLLGYSVGFPDAADNIDKSFVIKLQFKSHTYFFRAESEYTFQRWLETIRTVIHDPN